MSTIPKPLHRSRALRLLPWLLYGIATTGLLAQNPTYRRPPPPQTQYEWRFVARQGQSPDVAFSNLAALDFAPRNFNDTTPSIVPTSVDDVDGEAGSLPGNAGFSIVYDDGRLAQDFILNDAGSLRLPPDNLGAQPATGNFAYFFNDQRAADGSTVDFHRYRALPNADAVAAAADAPTGWELQFLRYFGEQRRFGLQAGFAFDGFDAEFRDTIPVENLQRLTFRHTIQGGSPPVNAIDPGLDEDGNPNPDTNSSSYVGARTPTAEERAAEARLLHAPDLIDPATGLSAGVDADTLALALDSLGNDLSLIDDVSQRQEREAALAEVLQYVGDYTPLDGDGNPVEVSLTEDLRLRSSIFTFRLGAFYQGRLIDRFHWQVSAGVGAVFYQGEFFVGGNRLRASDNDMLLAAGNGNDINASQEVITDDAFLTVYYGEFTLSYQFNRRVSLFIGGLFQSGEEFELEGRDRTATIDYSSQSFIEGGFGIRF